MDPQALREIFLTESEELLTELEQSLIALEADPSNRDAIHQLFRSAHTLKSNAAMVGFDPIVQLAHAAESVLSRVRDNDIALDAALTSLLLRVVDAFRNMLQCVIEQRDVVSGENAQSLQRELEQYLTPPSHVDEVAEQPKPSSLRVLRVDMRLAPDLFRTGQDPAFLIADLREVGDVLSVTAHYDALPEFDDFDPERCYLAWTVVMRSEVPLAAIEGVFMFLDSNNRISITDVTHNNSHLDELANARLGELLIEEGHLSEHAVVAALQQQRRIGEVLIASGAVQATTVERLLGRQRAARQIRRNTSIRVDTDKLDKLINLVGELAVTISQVHQTIRNPTATMATRVAVVETLEQIGRDLQSQVMSVRMVPIEETFSRFKRVARDLAHDMGKHVVLDTLGNETELDKNVSEQLADPLKHMVRNAIAHGLETPEERIRAGKSDTGQIVLRAEQRQGHVVIEISDDGRGIDPELVLAKARRLGLISDEQKLSERQVLELLFRPGFTTAEHVSEIAGRGVGLDVVKKNVGELHGQIEIESQLGRGTTFRIKLPLTLAIIEGMTVRVGSDMMTIPLTSVVELLSPETNRIATLEGKGELVDVRGEFVPVVRLSDVLDCVTEEASLHSATIVVVENDGRRFGIFVDGILGMSQAVVKPLRKAFSAISAFDHEYRKLAAVSGATILGDGNVALILDVPGIERMAFGELQ
jgi:two-component system chemotaxis sensor kinase CheA